MPLPTELQHRINQLNTNSLESSLGQLQASVAKYIKSASLDTSAADSINTIVKGLDTKLQGYNKLISDMKTALSGIRGDSDINGKLTTIGSLRRDIGILEERRAEAEEDKSTSDARKESVLRAEKKVSYDQLVGGIRRPIHPISVPILIILSIVFAGIACAAIYMIFSGSGGTGGTGGTGSSGVDAVAASAPAPSYEKLLGYIR